VLFRSLKHFNNIKYLYGIEINRQYVYVSKLRVLNYLKTENLKVKPKIKIVNSNIFDFDFRSFRFELDSNILVIGNPPWVTNTTLGTLNSKNLPKKNNFKNYNGYDALTGKSNFDISEYITLMLLKHFQNYNANLCFLVKNSVVKNIIFDQKINKYKISNLKKITFDAQKEFNVSVDACLFVCEFNKCAEFKIAETSLYYDTEKKFIGWFNNLFVSNIEDYKLLKKYDGKSQFIWRSGIKHDLTKIMVLKKRDDYYMNKLGEKISLEDDMVYCYLKGSYLKDKIISSSDLFTIITQKNITSNIDDIENKFPNTYKYLVEHENYFNSRKSSIYNGKPKFSIFGIGDYSFKPYKIAIASLYKTFSLSIITPDDKNKPIMLDDTCYFIGFDSLDFALITYGLINNPKIINFINTISFNDTKRKYTKELLMRIDLFKISQSFTFIEIKNKIKIDFEKKNLDISESSWFNFIDKIKEEDSKSII